MIQAKWYLQAAEGGYVRAMYNTSLCYSFGEGFPQSHKLARKWMKKAAECGHSKAQFEHGSRRRQHEGCGVSGACHKNW
ncbi:hypothetical protein Leryth_022064 [Lithospermum erythrorhizon]|nr:hypothetical protein Leryth_022064 [Lithospermum erythrorhizon]